MNAHTLHSNGPIGQDPVFELHGVSYGYGARNVLQDVTLTIPDDVTILVAGANGSGKTTLLKLLAGLLIPRQGHIRRLVQPGDIGNLGHETYIYPGLTVLENVSFWVRLYGGSNRLELLEQVLDRVGLLKVLYEPAGHLSRGMAQRLSLARVLALSPRVLLLDEPTAGLDSASKDMMRREVRRARDRGASVLWITHTPESELHMADLVLHLERGTVRMHAPGDLVENTAEAAH